MQLSSFSSMFSHTFFSPVVMFYTHILALMLIGLVVHIQFKTFVLHRLGFIDSMLKINAVFVV